MLLPALSDILLTLIMAYGVLLYIASSLYCVIVTLIARTTPDSTFLGKYIVYYGVFNVTLWGSLCVLLIFRKLGMLLLT